MEDVKVLYLPESCGCVRFMECSELLCWEGFRPLLIGIVCVRYT